MARILVYSGAMKGKSVELPADRRVTLGRSKTSDIRIPDRNMSRQHCAIWHGSSGYMVEDLESTNGTHLNGTRVKNAVLKDGDRLKMGDTELEFRVQERFDDSETKHDLKPVAGASAFEESQTDDKIEIVSMNKLPPAVIAPASGAPPVGAGRQLLKAAGEKKSKPVGRMKGAAARPRVSELRPERPNLLPGAAKAKKAAEKRVVVRRPKMQFCDQCNVSIPALDFGSGAKSWNGKLYCKECARKLNPEGGALGNVWGAGLEDDD